MNRLPDWVRQPNNYTCGAASTLWALRYLGHTERLSVKRLSEELHVKNVPWWMRAIAYVAGCADDDLFGTLPCNVVRVMSDYGHTVIAPSGFGNYFDKVLDRGGVCLTGYCRKERYGYEAHWVAVARDPKGYLAVMDPNRGITKGAKAQRHSCFKDSVRVILGFEP